MTAFKRILFTENCVFAFFVVMVLYGALKSPSSIFRLFLENPLIIMGTILFLGVLLFFIQLNKNKIYPAIHSLWLFIKRKAFFFLIASLIGLFIVQVSLLKQITVPIGWDVFDNFHSITTGNKEYSKIVLSLNPNNQFFFFMMYFINKFIVFIDITGSLCNTWLSWQIVNCLFIDMSLFLFYQASKRVFNQSVAIVAYSLFFLSFGLSPWLLTLYTDTAVLLFVTLVFFAYSYFQQVSSRLGKYFLLFFIGVGLACCFLMKPSSIIFFIAYSCIKIIYILLVKRNKQSMITLFVTSLFLLIGFTSALQAFHLFVEKQTITEIDKQKAKPWTLFVMMGLTGTGGYNDADTRKVNELPTPKAKMDYTKHVIKERLQKKGFIGYLRFLAQKNQNNTADGDFDWGWDGGDLIPETPAKTSWQERLRNLYYPQNPKCNYLRIYMHCFYLITLLGLLFSIPLKDHENKIAILKLALIGGLLYLLLFEGGRSRYLIQFMPFWYLLSTTGWLGFWDDIKTLNIQANQKIVTVENSTE